MGNGTPEAMPSLCWNTHRFNVILRARTSRTPLIVPEGSPHFGVQCLPHDPLGSVSGTGLACDTRRGVWGLAGTAFTMVVRGSDGHREW